MHLIQCRIWSFFLSFTICCDSMICLNEFDIHRPMTGSPLWGSRERVFNSSSACCEGLPPGAPPKADSATKGQKRWGNNGGTIGNHEAVSPSFTESQSNSNYLWWRTGRYDLMHHHHTISEDQISPSGLGHRVLLAISIAEVPLLLKCSKSCIFIISRGYNNVIQLMV